MAAARRKVVAAHEDAAVAAAARQRQQYNRSGDVTSDAPSTRSFGACGLYHNPGTPCPDYELLLKFFEAQQQDPWREINICYVPDAGEGDVTARLPWKVKGRWKDIGGVMNVG